MHSIIFRSYVLFTLLIAGVFADAQNAFHISGTIGATYEGYQLSTNPSSWTGYPPRRPANQFRFNINPVFSTGKYFTLPVNFNFVKNPVSYAGSYAGLKDQSLGQWITNPVNSFGINPKYKWAELQLGTQYLKYSELTTGDIGIFGAGISLSPKNYRLRFFTGFSQQGINYYTGPPLVPGAYQRNHWMLQFGKEKEGKYSTLFNLAKGKDNISSVSPALPGVQPEEGFTGSMVFNLHLTNWYIKSEAAESYFTKDLSQPKLATTIISFKPFIDGHTSTVKDWAANATVGRKTKKFDFSFTTKYVGPGFQTTGYPYLQQDKWENTVNTRFNAWKNKMNVVASAGQRVNNLSKTSLKAKQFIGNLDWGIQFTDKFHLNLNYNNFGFTTASGTNPYGVKNVSNDISIAGNYNWNTKTMSNILSSTIDYSNYDERDVTTGMTSSNKSITAMMAYTPVFFNNTLTPEFSVVYFNNTMPLIKNTLLTFSGGLGFNALKNKAVFKTDIQYTIGKLDMYTSNKNLSGSVSMNYTLTKKLLWNIFLSENYFRYGNELAPPVNLDGANYMESTYRTGLQYKF
jgi:hypothetical protein